MALHFTSDFMVDFQLMTQATQALREPPRTPRNLFIFCGGFRGVLVSHGIPPQSLALRWLYGGSTRALRWLYGGPTLALRWLYAGCHGPTLALRRLYENPPEPPGIYSFFVRGFRGVLVSRGIPPQSLALSWLYAGPTLALRWLYDGSTLAALALRRALR